MTNGERGGKTLSPLNGGELWKTASTSSSTVGERGEGKGEVDEAENDEDEDSEHSFKGRPWYRRPSPLWYVFYLLEATSV